MLAKFDSYLHMLTPGPFLRHRNLPPHLEGSPSWSHSVGSGSLAVQLLLSLSPGQTSSQTRPTPTITAFRCTRSTRPQTAKPARCSSGESLFQYTLLQDSPGLQRAQGSPVPCPCGF